MTMAALRDDDNFSTASTSSRVSHFGLNQCPKSHRLRAMKNDIKNEMDGCRRLFDATVACTEGTNDFDDAALDSDGARNGLRDMVFDFCLLYTSPSPRDKRQSRMPSSA